MRMHLKTHIYSMIMVHNKMQLRRHFSTYSYMYVNGS